jgi:hypothetical protein
MWVGGAVPPRHALIPEIEANQKYLEELAVPSSYRTQIELAPGDYHFELAMSDGEKFGRAEESVRVVDYSNSELAISGLSLCKRYHTPSTDERGPTRAPQYVPLMFRGQEFTPAGDLHFKRGEPLLAYLELQSHSRSEAADPSKLYMEMKVRDTKTGELKISTGPRPVDLAISATESIIPLVWTLAVDKLPAGNYRLEAQASDSAGQKTEWREKSFSVE